MIDINDWRHYSPQTLIDFVKIYDDSARSLNKIEKAYLFAEDKHKNQPPRDSKEPFITHPVACANFLAIMRTDIDSIVAGLLHDTLEDTDATYPEIKEKFGSDVAHLVVDVTKISRLEDANLDDIRLQVDINNPEELELLNRKKFADTIIEDPRSGIIKGSGDRLHNMLTIGYKTPIKQQAKARETLDLYAPLMNGYGIYRTQQILEDTSLKHLSPTHANIYNTILSSRECIKDRELPFLNDVLQSIIDEIRKNIKMVGHYDFSEMAHKSEEELLNETILVGDRFSRARIKHVYGIYDAFRKMRPKDEKQEADDENTMSEEEKEFAYIETQAKDIQNFDKIHDLRVIKLIMKDEISCWLARKILCDMYPPIDKYQHNYIANPKSNGYRSFHETVSINGKLVQFQIRTEEQEYRNTYGFAWELYKYQGPHARERIVKAFKNYPLYHGLYRVVHDETIQTLGEYRHLLDSEALKVKEMPVIDRISGRTRSIKEGSTIHDFAYLIGGHKGDHLSKAIVNDVLYTFDKDENGNIDFSSYPFDLKLQKGDEIYVEFDEKINCPKPNSDLASSSSKKLLNTAE